MLGAMSRVEISPWQPAVLGDAITLHADEGESSATIFPKRGALVSSLRIAGRELLYLDRATLDDPSKNVRGGIPVLFPAPGKLAGDAWQCGGKHGTLKQHGFARTQAWDVLRTESTPHASVTLGLRANAEMLAQFPWAFAAELEFTLQQQALALTTRIANTGHESLPFALGFHPYFNVPDKTRARIDTAATRAFDNVTKRVQDFRGFDLTQPELDLHLLDHGSGRCTLALGDGTGIAIEASSEFARWVIWTLAGKDFVCVEPWTAPGNALNSGEQLRWLEPGASATFRVAISWCGPGAQASGT